MLVIGQSGMDRVPLNPWFKAVGFRYISYAGKHLGRIVEGRKIGKLSLFHPPLQERRANLVEFQQKYL
jgi:hypothetical protein